ncbi:MAG: ribosomal protein S18-alanine N-acetyltransferase [Gammaproteobacteria bacterium]
MSQTDIHIRPMQAADVAAVSAIEQQAFPHPWGEQSFYDCIRVNFKCWVLEIGQQIIGYAIVMAVLDESQLLNIAIAPTHHGKKLGKYLLSWVLAQLKVTGTKEMFLEVRISNTAAIHLYETLGFQKIGIRKAYYPLDNGREDAVLYKYTY